MRVLHSLSYHYNGVRHLHTKSGRKSRYHPPIVFNSGRLLSSAKAFRGILSILITVTSQWAQWRIKSPASWLFTQPFIQAQIKEHIKVPRHWPFLSGIHRWPVNSPRKWPGTRKMLPFWWRHHGNMSWYFTQVMLSIHIFAIIDRHWHLEYD